ncbi:MAG: NTP transferase domain-containing protein [Eubacterium sp.]|nr:NTP transferase domain-containing protein [Eubacterium sp.]
MLKAIILAAGKGTRMKSELPKVLHTIDNIPMAKYVGDAVRAAGTDEICYVIGYKKDEVKAALSGDGISFAIQDEQLGTGHAVKCASSFIGEEGSVMVLCGDTPLITGETLKKFVSYHNENGNAVTVLSAIIDNPEGYGHIIRDDKGEFVRSVEHKDATDEEKTVKEINAGMYVFDAKALKDALVLLKNDNAQGEYYLPDTLEIIKEKGLKAGAYVLDDKDEIMGVNTLEQLAEAAAVIKARSGK